jgi:hypothetical protein
LKAIFYLFLFFFAVVLFIYLIDSNFELYWRATTCRFWVKGNWLLLFNNTSALLIFHLSERQLQNLTCCRYCVTCLWHLSKKNISSNWMALGHERVMKHHILTCAQTTSTTSMREKMKIK